MNYQALKRILDFLIALIALVIMLPIRYKMGSPIIFTQIRPGYKGKPFVLYKFRTMQNKQNLSDTYINDFDRVTNLGTWLRKTSIDELPGLINILKGEMSFVGPRPLLMEYLSVYSPSQARRHDVKPGVTGWAQINGRNAITWEKKFSFDLWYINNHSFIVDIKIIIITIWKVLSQQSINANERITMPIFKGSK